MLDELLKKDPLSINDEARMFKASAAFFTEVRKPLTKEASGPFSAIGRFVKNQVGGAAKSGVAHATQFSSGALSSKDMVGGVKRIWKKRGLSVPKEGLSRWERLKQGVRTIDDPTYANAMGKAHAPMRDFSRRYGSSPGRGVSKAEWDSARAAALDRTRKLRSEFDSGREFGRVGGVSDAARDIGKAMKGSDGLITPGSAAVGALTSGFTNPELLTRGAVKGSEFYRKVMAQRAAAARNKNLLLGGGVAGGGALAYSIGRRKKKQPELA